MSATSGEETDPTRETPSNGHAEPRRLEDWASGDSPRCKRSDTETAEPSLPGLWSSSGELVWLQHEAGEVKPDLDGL